MAEDCKIIFGPLQIGVATRGGAEASIHAVRKLASEFESDPGKILLKVDFSNAFNVVDRTEMLVQVLEKLPKIYRWVEYCYSQPTHLFFGNVLLESATGVQQGDPLGPLLFSLVLHPLAQEIESSIPLDLCVWYLDDGAIVGNVEDVFKAFELLREKGPARGLVLNIEKNEIWWPARRMPDPFPAEVIRVDPRGVKLLGAPVGNDDYTAAFLEEKLARLQEVHKLLREVDDAQVEFGLFRGCLQFNKINHLLRSCPPYLLGSSLSKFDSSFRSMVAEILRLSDLDDEQWEQASLPIRFAGLGVAQCQVVAGAAYIGSCALTKTLVAEMLKRDPEEYVPDHVEYLLKDHDRATGKAHAFSALNSGVQERLSDERHTTIFDRLKDRSPRSRNLMLACSMPHASDWLEAPPVPALGLGLRSENFRVALKFRLGIPVVDGPFPCQAKAADGKVCGETFDVLGDHAACCHHGPSLVFRHNNVRDIMGHSARGAGLAAVVLEKKNLVSGSKAKPGDITVQQFHRGFESTAFDVTITHPLQAKYINIAMEEGGVAAGEAHDKKLRKHLDNCVKEKVEFIPLAWESTGGTTETVSELIRKWTDMEAARGGYPAKIIRKNLYGQISCCLQRHLAQAVLDRLPEACCGWVD